jgi:hypothetical protein
LHNFRCDFALRHATILNWQKRFLTDFMAISRKKAVVRRLNQDWIAGYLPAAEFLHNGAVEMLALDGKTIQLDPSAVKWICYVRDFNSGEPANPERLIRKAFAGRPRIEGLVLRLQLTDGDLIEGLATNDLSLISAEGLFLTPPDIRSNTHRLWIPHSAIAKLEVITVIGATKRKQTVAPKPPDRQESLF